VDPSCLEIGFGLLCVNTRLVSDEMFCFEFVQKWKKTVKSRLCFGFIFKRLLNFVSV